MSSVQSTRVWPTPFHSERRSTALGQSGLTTARRILLLGRGLNVTRTLAFWLANEIYDLVNASRTGTLLGGVCWKAGVISPRRVGTGIRRFHPARPEEFPPDVHRPDHVPVALIPTRGTVEVPATTTRRVVVRCGHCLAAFATPRTVSAGAPRIDRRDVDADQLRLVFNAVEEAATSPRRNTPRRHPTRTVGINLSKRLEDDGCTAVLDGKSHQLIYVLFHQHDRESADRAGISRNRFGPIVAISKYSDCCNRRSWTGQGNVLPTLDALQRGM